ncbi:hypothetical protein QYE76_063990 [Lolium multiflorum]|uniref:Exopolygalacturonase n=1 Tax=Lolium multiflorum TaxID=4521 RepID=A0AAD8S836_LOLMU|nr:hypothetical protein QYE76_063990 [Lolium multiflorum]
MPARRSNLALLAHLCVSLAAVARGAAATSYSVVDYGAVADGRTNCAGAFLSAWDAACAAEGPAAVVVPAGEFLVSRARFSGPCRSGAVTVDIAGTVLAPVPYAGVQLWIVFQNVDGVAINGGTLDGRGQAYWACRRAGGGSSCPVATRSLTIYRSRNVLIQGLTSLNSAGIHVTVQSSTGVAIVDTAVLAPGDSPNTDGIHIKQSSDVTVRNARIGTGDDCISMVEGSSDVWIQGISCGPGHGISIGSLGDTPEQLAVRNITVRAVTLAGTTNGLRIKTWAKANSGIVDGVAFSDVVMRDVRNPIIVDQNYCPGNVSCPTEGSGIKITNVSYTDVVGTSATPVAVRFDCSPSRPCTGITMRNVRLSYGEQPGAAESLCRNAHGVAYGQVVPPNCLADQEMLCYK